MSIKDRMERYKTTGAGAGMVRVEVLVPPAGRNHVVTLARTLRAEHRSRQVRHVSEVNSEAVNDRAKLLMHRLIARQLGTFPNLLEMAKEQARRTSTLEPDHAEEWRQLLSSDLSVIRNALTKRSETMDRLRLSSPFALIAGFSDPGVRKRIWKKARTGLERQNRSQTHA